MPTANLKRKFLFDMTRESKYILKELGLALIYTIIIWLVTIYVSAK